MTALRIPIVDDAVQEVPAAPPSKILVIDIGGSKVKVLASGQIEPRRMPSGKELTPMKMIEGVRNLTGDWDYDAVSIGYPGQVGPAGPRSEPGNLGVGWVGFNFGAALEKPVRIINDAAMQGLGSYEGGRMLFLGLGTGLGSVLISEHAIIPLELGELPFKERLSLGRALGQRGLDRLGKAAWRRAVRKTVVSLMKAFVADYVVIGGGNARRIKKPPPGVRMGHNLTAFRGGFRLWNLGVPTLSSDDAQHPETPVEYEWRLI